MHGDALSSGSNSDFDGPVELLFLSGTYAGLLTAIHQRKSRSARDHFRLDDCTHAKPP
jgi:hypothetical protein